MYLGNLLSAGDFVTIEPFGVPLCIQYNSSGNIEYVRIAMTNVEEVKECDLNTYHTFTQIDFLHKLVESKTVPNKIFTRDGTVKVYGILYTSSLCRTPGCVPDCIIDDLLIDYMQNPNQFNFFASYVVSTESNFSGALPTRQWLANSKFKLLPGFVVPSNMTDESFKVLVDNSQYTFIFPLIQGFVTFHKGKVLHKNTGMTQTIVNHVDNFVDDNGYFKSTIDDTKIVLEYTSIIQYNIQKGMHVVFDKSSNPVYSEYTGKKKVAAVSSQAICPVCSKLVQVKQGELVTCSDPNCVSKLLLKIQKFVQVLNLPINMQEIKDTISKRELTSVLDVLDRLDKKTKIKTTYQKLLASIVPTFVVRSPEFFTLLINKCTNNKNTLLHYLSNPEHIAPDLDMNNPNFVTWISDPYNLNEVIHLINSSYVHVVEIDKQFDGAPIFRGNKIYITGTFIRGDKYTISSILSSYSAKVVTEFSDDVSMVVVGDQLEDVDSVSLRKAKDLRIPTWQESAFFDQYEIDEDMKMNLV